LLSIYCLAELFFYIPEAALAGVIIHAVGDLITPPDTVYQFWRVSPFDAVIFFIGVLVTVFISIEIGVYCTICISLAVFLFRAAKARGQFLGRVTIHSVVGDHLVDSNGKYDSGLPTPSEGTPHYNRSIFLPTSHTDGSNPDIKLEQPHPGIFIYRSSEGFNYPNANHYSDYLVQTIFQNTRRTNPLSYSKRGDRPWNDPGPRRGKQEEDRSHLPTLRAVILDFSSVNHVDVTSIQNLIDVRNQLDLYASPDSAQWHFAHINNRWTKRALSAAGFGFPTPTSEDGFHRWKPIFSVAEIEGSSSAAAHAEIVYNEQECRRHLRHDKINDAEDGSNSQSNTTDFEVLKGENSSGGSSTSNGKVLPVLTDSKACRTRSRVALVQGVNRPFFHIDLTSALQSAVANSDTPGSFKPEAD
jgi:sodium-independent sulfate anion transporter 11